MDRFLTKAELAAHFQRSPRTIDNWHSADLIVAHRRDDGSLVFDIAAVDLAMRMNPRRMRDGRKRGKAGRVLPMPVEVVE